eukprot:CAMPEP_0206481342 /NCGR_PEP_ID=MMETSP0324_2-20121206/38081_1 /ASSEMBLY_ACC=CAM_ASM_000836 /TAXON_ID=2866 /ORGANISM="Crypthecodinium cohnii, Strain Seligo" /LENGTH=106 /DNA_ID=CAMNT_0053958799 /DNA_START=294 /DNA_END=614 /DNA_ORIENTATION=-
MNYLPLAHSIRSEVVVIGRQSWPPGCCTADQVPVLYNQVLWGEEVLVHGQVWVKFDLVKRRNDVCNGACSVSLRACHPPKVRQSGIEIRVIDEVSSNSDAVRQIND